MSDGYGDDAKAQTVAIEESRPNKKSIDEVMEEVAEQDSHDETNSSAFAWFKQVTSSLKDGDLSTMGKLMRRAIGKLNVPFISYYLLRSIDRISGYYNFVEGAQCVRFLVEAERVNENIQKI